MSLKQEIRSRVFSEQRTASPATGIGAAYPKGCKWVKVDRRERACRGRLTSTLDHLP